MKRIYLPAFLPVLWAMMGCAPVVRVQSRVNAAEKVEIKKIYVVLSGGEKLESLMRAMDQHFTRKFAENGIESRVYTIDPLSLDPNEYKSDLWKYNPDAVLFFRFAEGSSREGSLIRAVFNATLYEKKMSVILWRANASADFGRPVSWDSFGEEFVRGILEKMWQDGLMGKTAH